MQHKRNFTFWLLQIPGWLLFTCLVVAQGISAINYELGVGMGTQESADSITEVGTAFWYGFALGDLVIYIPLMLAGLVGHLRSKIWGRIILAAGLGITVYWPIVCLAALQDARDATGWNMSDNEIVYWIVLPLIALWGILGLWILLREAGIDEGEILPKTNLSRLVL